MAEIYTSSLKHYSEHGWAIFPQVFYESETQIMRREALRAKESFPDKVQWRKSKESGKIHPALLFWPRDVNDALKHYASDHRLLRIVSSILGFDLVQINNQIYFREPGDGDEFAWHQDITFRVPAENFVNIESSYLQTIIAIDPLSEENGTIEFISGSQHWGDMNLVPRGTEEGLRSFKRNGWYGTKLIMKPGDVAIWSLMAVHGSEKNTSSLSRMTYMNGFAKSEAVLNKTSYVEINAKQGSN